MRCFSSLPTPLLVLLSALTASAVADDDSSSLKINVITPISCSRPTRKGDKIAVHYSGRLLSTGAEFDSSYKRGQPFTFTLGAGQVIQGWDQGLLDMCPGEGRELTIPPELGYGNRAMGPIPGGSTLVFDTELMDIPGAKQETISAEPTATTTKAESSVGEGAFSIATAPSTPPEDEKVDKISPPPPPPAEGSEDGPMSQQAEDENAECQLLGPFALLVQAALGAVAVLSLVLKRYRETPKRPWKIWFFDVSKQVFGSMLTHVLNLAMSMFGNTEFANMVAQVASQVTDQQGRRPNPCSYYLLNLGIDTTLGIPVLFVLLKVLHALFLKTALASPPESIKSGNYGQPPKWTWYFKQLLIYFIGIIGMKLFVLFLLKAMPWLPWVGDWALKWTEGNESLQIAFAMFIFPLAMNALQYIIIDSFIMDKKRESGYQAVNEDDEEDASQRTNSDDTESVTEVDESPRKMSDEPLKEVNPTPLPVARD